MRVRPSSVDHRRSLRTPQGPSPRPGPATGAPKVRRKWGAGSCPASAASPAACTERSEYSRAGKVELIGTERVWSLGGQLVIPHHAPIFRNALRTLGGSRSPALSVFVRGCRTPRCTRRCSDGQQRGSLALDRPAHALRWRIVPAITLSAHAAVNPMALQTTLVVAAGVLTATIRMVQHALARTPAFDRHL
jgi:hypothetical protein